MTFEEIFAEWEKDSQIDNTELSNEALKIPQLHNKYYRIYVPERIKLRKHEADLKRLKQRKTEFYSNGPDEETREFGWKLPAKGLILKAEVQNYVETDDDIIQLSLRIGVQQEKCEFLMSIIKSFSYRGYNIKTSLDHIKFVNGL